MFRKSLFACAMVLTVGACGSSDGPPPLTGAVSGLMGIGLVLQDGAGHTVNVSPGSSKFQFPSALVAGTPYAVAVASQPNSPLQFCTVQNGTGTVTSQPDDININCSDALTLAFVASSSDGQGAVTTYVTDPATGALGQMAGNAVPAGQSPVNIAITPSGDFIYVFDTGVAGIFAFQVNKATGVLTQVAGSPFAAANADPWITISTSGQFLYVSNSLAYRIDSATGTLIPINESAAGTSGGAIVFSSDGKFAYALDASGPSIASYSVDAVTGALSTGTTYPVPLSPPISVWTGSCSALSASPANLFLYVGCTYTYKGVVLSYESQIQGYSIDSSSGALSATEGSPYSAPDRINQSGFLVQYPAPVFNPNGNYLFWMPGEFTLDSASGALSLDTNEAFAGSTSDDVSTQVFAPGGKFAYEIVDGVSVEVFSFDAPTGQFALLSSIDAATNSKLQTIALANISTN